ncbi:MAG: glycosyltransferase [Gemmatimonadales bacterium]
MPPPPPLRVLHVDSGREYRGGQNQVRLLARALARESDVEQRLVTKRGSELARRAAATGVAVREAPWGIGLDPRAWWRLRREAAAFRPQIIHAHDAHALRLTTWAGGWLDANTGTAAPPRLVATRRVVFPVRRRGPLCRADAVVAISEAVQTTLVAAGVPPAEITVVPSGIDPDEVRAAAAAPFGLRARLGLPDRATVAANVAALEPAKDQATLIRAAGRARALRPDLRWVIAGAGPERGRLEALVRALGLADRVHLLGHVEQVDALIRESDVLVVSSREEGLGSVVLHALALGTPVVATRGGGLPEIVPAPWLAPVGDAEALAGKVVQALDHPAPVLLPPQFTASAMARGVLAVYRSLV